MFGIVSTILYILFLWPLLVATILWAIMYHRILSYKESKWWRSVVWEYWYAFPEDRIKVRIYILLCIFGFIFGVLARISDKYILFFQ